MTEKPSNAYLCGQLWATLHILRVVGYTRSGDREKLASKEVLEAVRRNPGRLITEQLDKAPEHLVGARTRRPPRTKAADALWLRIPEFLPPGGVPASFSSDADDFQHAFRTQQGIYEVEYRDAMK
ncbi:hypothetical protein [Streptomyces sp. NPDC001480]|uniref:hypothetical protein n=1 Tax=Streptomyces sp. NPDC001480 TaxID=3364577 RepID=UPI0036D1BAD7